MLPLLGWGTNLAVVSVLTAAHAGLATGSLGAPRRGTLLVAAGALVLEGIAHAAWAFADAYPDKARGASFATGSAVFAALLLPALLVSAVLRPRLVARPAAPAEPAPTTSVSRRAFALGVTAAAPAAAAAVGVTGFGAANTAPAVPRIPFTWTDLPPTLDGMSILHLSDLHLGVERRAADVEALVGRLVDTRARVDLVAITGDVAEHVGEIAPAMRALHALRPSFGVVASLGNHEYLNGASAARDALERAGVPVLVSAGTTLRGTGRALWVAGLDDPRVMHGDIDPFLTASLDRALDQAPAGAFRLVLSHRPEGLVPATRHGAELVLSGHTHGGQIGFAGKSAFERVWPERYLWGPYARGRTRLYTTSGFGHWFPFRVLCPTEAPLVTLSRGPRPERVSCSGYRTRATSRSS